ncbi:MAG: lipocalin family protein [Flavobacteriales bacterium]
MRAIILHISLLGILLSCQKQDPIIGNWRIERDLINEETVDFLECSKKTVNSFTKDSLFIFENYVMDETGNCQSLGKVTGFWRKKNDSVYLLSKGKYIDTIRLRFLKNNTTMILKNKYEEDIFQLQKITVN